MNEHLKVLHNSFVDLIEHDTELALKTITGMFFSFTLEYIKRSGKDESKEIIIGGKGQRKIVIQAEAADDEAI